MLIQNFCEGEVQIEKFLRMTILLYRDASKLAQRKLPSECSYISEQKQCMISSLAYLHVYSKFPAVITNLHFISLYFGTSSQLTKCDMKVATLRMRSTSVHKD